MGSNAQVVGSHVESHAVDFASDAVYIGSIARALVPIPHCYSAEAFGSNAETFNSNAQVVGFSNETFGSNAEGFDSNTEYHGSNAKAFRFKGRGSWF